MKLKDKIVQSMAKNNVIKQDEIDVYRFGVQLLSETLFSFAIFLIIAALLGSVTEMIIFTIAFTLLRQYAGGFHADRFVSCLLISCSIITVFCIGIHIVDAWVYIVCTLAVISLIIIFLLSPVDSKYKTISNKDRKKYKNKLINLLIIEIVIAAFIMPYSVHFAMCIFFSWIVLSSLLIAGISKNKRQL